MEKFITLNHLKMAVQSLLTRFGNDINTLDNSLSPVAKTGNYEDLINTPEISTPDWEQNDSTANDYIENRTHWREIDSDFVWYDGEITYNAAKLRTIYMNVKETPFIENKTYTVIYDNVSYNLTSYLIYSTSTSKASIALGNSDYLGSSFTTESTHDTSVPFFIKAGGDISGTASIYRTANNAAAPANDTSAHSLKIIGPIYAYHTIDDYYLNGKLITKGTGGYAEEFNYPNNEASGNYSHAEGFNTIASDSASHAEGNNTTASGNYSHTEGYSTIASQSSAHAEGWGSLASGQDTHAEGWNSIASGNFSHAEGAFTVASNQSAHAEGNSLAANITLTGDANVLTYTYTEDLEDAWVNYLGEKTIINSFLSTYSQNQSYNLRVKVTNIDSTNKTITVENTLSTEAISNKTYYLMLSPTAAGIASHAEGGATVANNNYAHSEGHYTKATGLASHASGQYTQASGGASVAMNFNTIAARSAQTVIGAYNIEDTVAGTTYTGNIANTNFGQYAFIVGNGTDEARSNAYTLDWAGNGVYSGKLTVGTNPTNNMDVTTKQYVDNAINGISPTETDPTVPAWAKQATKPTYTASEVGALPDTYVPPKEIMIVTFTQDENENWTADKTFNEILEAANNGKIVCAVRGDVTNVTNKLLYFLYNAKSSQLRFGAFAPVIITSLTKWSMRGYQIVYKSDGEITIWNENNNLITEDKIITEITSSSKDTEYPSAKAVYDFLTTALGNITDFSIEVVQSLPATGEQGVFYFVSNSGSGNNIYDEYVYVNNAFEKIGTTEIDLSNYLQTTDIADWAKAANKPSYTASEVGAPSLTSANGIETVTIGASNYNDGEKGQLKLSNAADLKGYTTIIPNATSDKTIYLPASGGTLALTSQIPAAQVQSDWNATTGMGVILNKPTIPTVPTNVSSFTNDSGYLTLATLPIYDGTVQNG